MEARNSDLKCHQQQENSLSAIIFPWKWPYMAPRPLEAEGPWERRLNFIFIHIVSFSSTREREIFCSGAQVLTLTLQYKYASVNRYSVRKLIPHTTWEKPLTAGIHAHTPRGIGHSTVLIQMTCLTALRLFFLALLTPASQHSHVNASEPKLDMLRGSICGSKTHWW